MRINLQSFAVAVAVALLAGCGTQSQSVKFAEPYKAAKESRLEVPAAKNATGKTFDEIDVEKTFTEELSLALTDEGLLADSNFSGPRLAVPCQIAEYSPGDAFKRWLLPGYGSTVLAVKCDLVEPGGDKAVGSAEARRTVDAGGAYTIGAWRSIFGKVAKDLAKEIKTTLQK